MLEGQQAPKPVLRVLHRDTAYDPVNLVLLRKKEFSEIRPILAGDTGD
jgi:hypothetical protein